MFVSLTETVILNLDINHLGMIVHKKKKKKLWSALISINRPNISPNLLMTTYLHIYYFIVM